MSACILGIDVGTTTIKCLLLDPVADRVVSHAAVESGAYVSGLPAGRGEQCMRRIAAAIGEGLRALQWRAVTAVTAVALSGQMHGVTSWPNRPDHCDPAACTPLVTWEDARCSREFLDRLRETTGDARISSGYGMATLAWLREHGCGWDLRTRRVGTAHDWLAGALAGTASPPMHATNAASWGCYDVIEQRWIPSG